MYYDNYLSGSISDFSCLSVGVMATMSQISIVAKSTIVIFEHDIALLWPGRNVDWIMSCCGH